MLSKPAQYLVLIGNLTIGDQQQHAVASTIAAVQQLCCQLQWLSQLGAAACIHTSQGHNGDQARGCIAFSVPHQYRCRTDLGIPQAPTQNEVAIQTLLS
jgi:hypothetical protein